MTEERKFRENLTQLIGEKLGGGYEVGVYVTDKINVGRLHALTISKKGEWAATPAFYLDSLYMDYLNNTQTLEGIAAKILNDYRNNVPKNGMENILGDILSEREKIKGRVFFRTFSLEKNRALLENCVHRDFLDLSLVLYLLIGEDREGIRATCITKDFLDKSGLDREETLTHAMQNTQRLFPERVLEIQEVLNMMGMQVGTKPYVGAEKKYSPLVLTNSSGINGATALFYPNVLKRVAEEKGANLFAIPSSIHEFLLIGDYGELNCKDLTDMLHEVNRDCVQDRDVLSDNVYYYDLEKDRLSFAQ